MAVGAGAAVAIVAVADTRVVFGVFTVIALAACLPFLRWVRPAMRPQRPAGNG